MPVEKRKNKHGQIDTKLQTFPNSSRQQKTKAKPHQAEPNVASFGKPKLLLIFALGTGIFCKSFIKI